MPDQLQSFLIALETTRRSEEVWNLLVRLGTELQLPFIEFVSVSGLRDWRRTRFVRASYDSSWIEEFGNDPEYYEWTYFSIHAKDRLTPIAIGLEFLEDGYHVPEKRVAFLRAAAARGMRAGLSLPLRQVTPPRSSMLNFFGDHSKRDMQAIIQAHGWTLHAAALLGHQRYQQFFAAEFRERNHITDKQVELIALIGQGYQDKTIADRLGVSISAVRQRMSALLQNTGLSSRAELAVLAMRLGLLPDLMDHGEDGLETYVQMDSGGIRTRPPTK